MYRILGSDGKEYGPVSEAQLREWLREGRVGGSTQVQSAETASWTNLHALPEFADMFQATSPLPPGRYWRLPPVVRTFGWLNIGVGVFNLVRQFGTLGSMYMVMNQGTVHVTQVFGNPQFLLFQVLALVGVILRVISGIGLLRGREWARKVAVYYAAFATLLGGYFLIQSAVVMSGTGRSPSPLASIPFLLQMGVSLLLLAFNVATMVGLGRKTIREALCTSRVAG